MRQKVMLQLSVQETLLSLFEQKQHLLAASLRLFKAQWPEVTEPSGVPQEFFIDTDDEESDDEKEEPK